MPATAPIGAGTTSRLGRGLFVAAVVLLIALGVWWIVLLDRSLRSEHDLLQQRLADAAALHAARAAVTATLPPLGTFAVDDRFEVVDGPAAKGELAATLRGPLRLRAAAATVERLESHYGRRRAMLVGEGVLLCSLLLAVVAMLYRLFRAERRFRDEIEGFLSRVTHEMKTPLAGIKAVLQSIESGRLPPERLPELVGKALRSVEREEALVENLLLAQRLRTGAKLAAEPVDAGAMVRRIVAARVDGALSQVAFVVEGDDALWVRGDAAALQSIVDNLLDNAGKYGASEVRIALDRREGAATIVVDDDGIGFDPARREALFLAFVRDPGGIGGPRGTGLGLSIARGLARAMRGDLVADSDGAGRGARFTLSLPLADPASIAYATGA